ncbi:MAG TPA: hypothetical protein VHX65_00765 [Pirellulales bacterium]|nr:hypothetical protein [Pirellulales bacterium]
MPGSVVEACIDGYNSLLVWTFDADFRGDGDDGMPKAREQLAGYRETDRYFSNRFVDLQAIRSHTIPGTSTVFGGVSDLVSVTSPEQLSGGNVRVYRQNVIWAAIGDWSVEPPTLRQLLDACPMLKPPGSQKSLEAFMDDKPAWSYSTLFSDDPAVAGWRIETPAKVRPDLEALLLKLGFRESDRTTHVWLPHEENGAERHTWPRSSDAASVSITRISDKIEIGYHGPQHRNGVPESP